MTGAASALAGRLARGLASWMRIAWWGVVSPRLGESRPLVVVQAVILGERGLLLSLRDDLWGWELPGGTLEPGEAPEEALVREVREETRLEIEVLKPVGCYRRTGFRPHAARVFLCRARSGDAHPGGEVLAVRWWPIEALPDGLFPWYEAPIADALADRGPVERHDRQGVAWIARAAVIDVAQRWRGL